MRWLSRVVTGAVVISIVAAVALLIRAKVPSSRVGNTFTTFAQVRDGSRLAIGSPVVIAGVRIGEVTHLTIEGHFARVDMRLKDDVQIPIDSFITRRADSLFGDSYLEIIVGGGDEGAPNGRMLRTGEQIEHVIEGGSTDTVLRAVARTMPKIDNALDVIHDFMGTGRKWTAGPMLDRIVGLDRWLQAGNLDGPLERADQAMISFESGTTRAADTVHDAIPTVARRLASFDQGVTDADHRIVGLRTSVVDGFRDARAGIDRVDPTIDQIGEVVSAIDEGRGDDYKGTLGRLVNDPGLGNDLDDLSEAGRDGAANLDHFKSWLGMRFEYNIFSRVPRVYATAELRAHGDNFFLIEFERGPLGGLPSDDLTDAPNSTSYTRTQEITDTMRFTAEFGKRLGHFQFRGGIKDSTPGLGVDALMFDGKLRLSADLFGAFDATPRLKVAGMFEVFRSVYVLAGIDDALNKPGYLLIDEGNQPVPYHFNELRYGRDYFVGATLHFDDEDLALLLRIYGALIIGLL